MPKEEVKSVYIDKFKIEKSVKAKLKKKAKAMGNLNLTDFLRMKLTIIANEK